MRAAAARRDGRGHRLRRRPRRPGARLAGCRLRLAARGGPERRLRRPAGERRRGQRHPRRGANPGAARRRHPRHGRHRGLARRRRAPRHPGQRRGEEPAAGARSLPRLSRTASPSASTRATAWSPPRAGRKPPPSTARDLALRFEDAGVAAIIYTDISRDGMLSGVNVAQTVDLARHLTTPVIASGRRRRAAGSRRAAPGRRSARRSRA